MNSYLKTRVLDHLMFDLVKPSCQSLEPIKSLLISQIGLKNTQRRIDQLVNLKRKQLESKLVSGQLAFIHNSLCMICERVFESESSLRFFVVISPTLSNRHEIRYCLDSNCVEVAHLSYVNGHYNTLIQPNMEIWNPFDEQGLIIKVCLIHQGVQINDAVLFRIPCFRNFEDDPIPKIYMVATFVFNDPDPNGFPVQVRRAINLLELIQNNPNLLAKVQAKPLIFEPHLFFSKDQNQQIQAYLQEVRNFVDSTRTD